MAMPRGANRRFIRVDTDVLLWFKEQGRGHLTRMNAVLRPFMDAHKTSAHGNRSGVVYGNDLSIHSGRLLIIENGREIDFHVGIP